MNFSALIEKLDKIIDEAKSVPLTNRVMVDKDQVMEILADMRMHLPDEMKEAKRVLDKRDEIISNARGDADKIISDAEREREIILDKHQITEDARRQADDICNKAEAYDRQVRDASHQYADSILSDLQKAVEETMNIVNTSYLSAKKIFDETMDQALKPVDKDLYEIRDVLRTNRDSIAKSANAEE